MDYLNLHECYYAFLALQPLFFYPRKLIFLNEGELQALPREEQKICVSLPQVPTNVVHKDFFDFMHNRILRNKYLRLLRSVKDGATESRDFWALLNSERLTEEYRKFEEEYLINFAKKWCQKNGIPCTDKPIDFRRWKREGPE